MGTTEVRCLIHPNSSGKVKGVIKSMDEYEKTYFPKSYKKLREERRLEKAKQKGGERAVAEEEGKIMAEKVLKKVCRRVK